MTTDVAGYTGHFITHLRSTRGRSTEPNRSTSGNSRLMPMSAPSWIPLSTLAVIDVLEVAGRVRGVDRDAAGGDAHDVQLRRIALVLFGCPEGRLGSARVAQQTDGRT